jgi:hypothetical protein
MTQNSKFVYVSSFDELTWLGIVTKKSLANRCYIPWSDRPEVRNWVETCCGSTVLCWNGTSTPDVGQSNWASILAPDQERCYLIFVDSVDNEMFLLKYADRFRVKNFGGQLERILADSKKP